MARTDPRETGEEPQANGNPLDLSRVVERSRNMLDPELIMTWDSYMANMTALAQRLMTQVAVATGRGSSQPAYLDLTELTPGSKDLVARPTLEKGPSTVDVRWVGRKVREPRIDLRRFMLLGRFTIEHGLKAHIPVVRPEDGDPRMVFYFSKARFAMVGESKGRKKGSDSQTNPGTGTTGEGGGANQG